jgi:RNA polymerase sigma factor (sigma-70 family)
MEAIRTNSEVGVVSSRSNVVEVLQSSSIFDDAYLARLRRGDEETAKHFDSYFRRILKVKLWVRFGHERQEELIDEVMVAAMEKIMSGEPRNAASLPAYVRGICANLARRPSPATQDLDLLYDRVPDRGPSPEQTLIAKEKAQIVQEVLGTLKARDRNGLVDLFYHELDRDEVCTKHGVSREQLRLLLFRARKRFQERWAER